ncbi:hypothetical protein D3C77_553540 [compost metagenome]
MLYEIRAVKGCRRLPVRPELVRGSHILLPGLDDFVNLLLDIRRQGYVWRGWRSAVGSSCFAANFYIFGCSTHITDLSIGIFHLIEILIALIQHLDRCALL